MSSTLHPDDTPPTTKSDTAYFGRIPEHAFVARARHELKSRDLELLGLVMTYAATGNSLVQTHQRTLARRLSCCLRTVQRSLARLARHGFLTKRYRRDTQGRLQGLSYDVAATLAMMPHPRGPQSTHAKAAKKPAGDPPAGPVRQTPAPTTDREPDASAPKRQICPGKNEKESAERDNTPPFSPVVQRLIQAGVFARIAAQLVARWGEARCRQALEALSRRAGVRNPAGWLSRCLTEGWDLSGPLPPPRPRSQHLYRPPSPLPPKTSDCLDHLPSDRRAVLEHAARAALAAELPVLRDSFLRGKSLPAVQDRMRRLLAAAGEA